MNLIKKVLIVLVLLVVIAIIGGYTFLQTSFPKVSDAPDISVEITPDRIERGEYLAHHVSLCMDCHGTRDWNTMSGPPVSGTEGVGGEKFGPEMGFPGNFYSRNITPYGVGDWTDGELYRAITAGVSRDGSPLFPIMPWEHYGKMDQEDIYSIIAYIRSLEPIESEIAESKADFPMNLIMRTLPHDGTPQKRPDPSDPLAYGKYMTNASGCFDCHTPSVKGQFIEGTDFSGGMEFHLPAGITRSANITPSESGIGDWTEEEFINRFKAFDRDDLEKIDITTDFQTPMPWSMYAGMKETDLRAIFHYLKTVEPIDKEVIKFTAMASE